MRSMRMATAVLAGAAALVGVFLVRVVALLADLGRRGARPVELLRVAGLALVLLAAGALLVLALRWRPARRVNAALAVASTIAVLYLAELALELAAPGWRTVRQKLHLLERLRAQGRDVYPGVEPVRLLRAGESGRDPFVLVDGRPVMPVSGMARRTTVDCKEGGDWLVYESDEHGFHNPPGVWSLPAIDLAFVGDSFVHGACVPSEVNLVGWARRRVPATLNLGTSGNGPLLMLAAVREYLTHARPRTVVWCHFGGNDLLDLRRERRHAILARYLEPDFTQGLFDRPPALDAALRQFSDGFMMPLLARHSRPRIDGRELLTLATLRSRAGLTFAAPYRLVPTEEEYALFGRILEDARRTVEGWGGRLVFAYMPAWSEAPRQLGEAEYARLKAATARRTCDLVRALGLPVVDVEARFAAEPDPGALYACPGCHYGPQGYEIAADAILDGLERGPR